MRILYFSDIHTHFKPLDTLPDADLVLIGGDFTNFGTPEDFRAAVKTVEARFPHFFAVAGNLDPREADDILQETGHWLPPRAFQAKGLSLLGLSGSNTCPKPTPFQWDDKEMNATLKALSPDPLDILVTHAPPMGSGADVIPNGMHVGSQAVANLLQAHAPALNLCGHIHEARGVYTVGKTTVVNCGEFGEEGRHAVIEWTDRNSAPVVTLA